jgi:hypothetical protein
MIRFNPVTDSLELVTASAQAIHYDLAWIEDDAVADTVVDGSAAAIVSAIGTVAIMAAGAANKSRRLQHASFINKGAALNTVTLQKDVSATNVGLVQANLMPNETLRYHSNRGWICYDAEGREKQAPVGSQVYVTQATTQVVLAGDVVNNNAVANTIQDVAGLSFAVNANETYWFRAVIFYTAAATTTGSRWSVNGPAAPTLLTYASKYTLTAATETTNFLASTYDQPAASNASSLTVGNMAIVEGYIRPSANGTVVIRFASEVANSAITAKAGSKLAWMRVL